MTLTNLKIQNAYIAGAFGIQKRIIRRQQWHVPLPGGDSWNVIYIPRLMDLPSIPHLPNSSPLAAMKRPTVEIRCTLGGENVMEGCDIDDTFFTLQKYYKKSMQQDGWKKWRLWNWKKEGGGSEVTDVIEEAAATRTRSFWNFGNVGRSDRTIHLTLPFFWDTELGYVWFLK